jgi:predicted TIM-barrel fold metal-dependent hydrolase
MDYKLLSVDDHLLEPPDLWQSRVAARYREAAPQVLAVDGVDTWVYGDSKAPVIGMFATAGKPPEEWSLDPVSYTDMHAACYDAAARVEAMRCDGVVGSITFPTACGFGGRLFAQQPDKELGDVCVRAYNDFMFEEWCAAGPDVLIPTIICQLWDPTLAAQEVLRCAARGARSLTFPENPYVLGLPPLHDTSWDPLWHALSETGIAVSMHGGASGRSLLATPQSHFMQAIVGAPIITGGEVITELMFSRVTQKFPDISWIVTEVGAGYLPYLLERADSQWEWNRHWHGFPTRPSEIFHRSVYVPLVHERFAVVNRHEIGVGNLMWESDFPHPESHWPNSQKSVAMDLEGVPPDEVAAITHGNAARVLRWNVA